MPTFHVAYLSRDRFGRYAKEAYRLPAESFDEVESYLLHEERNGRAPIEGPVTISKLNGPTKRFEP